MKGRMADPGAIYTLHHVDGTFTLSPDDITLLADNVAAWGRLQTELKAHGAWMTSPSYADQGHYEPGMSGSVGLTDDGHFYGGAYVDGDWFDEERDHEIEGDTPAATIDALIAELRAHRAREDAFRAEMAADDPIVNGDDYVCDVGDVTGMDPDVDPGLVVDPVNQ
jgi:hypothetical protein